MQNIFYEYMNTNYFYIENTYNGENTVTLYGRNYDGEGANSVEYSKDGENWQTINLLTEDYERSITLDEGEKVYFRNDNGKWSTGNEGVGFTFNTEYEHKVGGNVNTLLNYNDPDNAELYFGCFYKLFGSDETLTDASGLILPSTTLAEWCYGNMFSGCSSLTSAPELPATTLADCCYTNMFFDCSSLTSTPELPATTLADCCYEQMFFDCSSLTSTPELPATTLAEWGYSSMFSKCENLNRVVIYADDISANNCLNDWLNGVALEGTFYNLGSAEYEVDSVSGIPEGWTETHEPPVPPTPHHGLPIEVVDFLTQLKDRIDNNLTTKLPDMFDEAIDTTLEEGKLKYDLFRNALVDMDIALRKYTAAFNHLKEVCGVKGYLQ